MPGELLIFLAVLAAAIFGQAALILYCHRRDFRKVHLPYARSAPPLMEKAEFEAHREAYHLVERFSLAAFFVIEIGWFAFFFSSFEHLPQLQWDKSALANPIFLGVVAHVGGLAVLVALLYWKAVNESLKCPSCGKLWIAHLARRVAALGTCPQCDRTVIRFSERE